MMSNINKLKYIAIVSYVIFIVLGMGLFSFADEIKKGCCLNVNAEALCGGTEVAGSGQVEIISCCPDINQFPNYYGGKNAPLDKDACNKDYFRIDTPCSNVESCNFGCCCGIGGYIESTKPKIFCEAKDMRFVSGSDCKKVCTSTQKVTLSADTTNPTIGSPVTLIAKIDSTLKDTQLWISGIFGSNIKHACTKGIDTCTTTTTINTETSVNYKVVDANNNIVSNTVTVTWTKPTIKEGDTCDVDTCICEATGSTIKINVKCEGAVTPKPTLINGQTCNSLSGCICDGKEIANTQGCSISQPPTTFNCGEISSGGDCTKPANNCYWYAKENDGRGICKTDKCDIIPASQTKSEWLRDTESSRSCSIPNCEFTGLDNNQGECKNRGCKYAEDNNYCVTTCLDTNSDNICETTGTGDTSQTQCIAGLHKPTLSLKSFTEPIRIRLTWNGPQGDSISIDNYYIYRCEVDSANPNKCDSEFDKNKNLVGVVNSATTNYEDVIIGDNNLGSAEKFSYKVSAVYSGFEYPSDTKTISIPDSVCNGVMSTKGFCDGSGNAIICDVNNVATEKGCSATRCTSTSSGTDCFPIGGCPESNGKPFGMYYTYESLRNTPNILLDITKTIVDTCNDCKKIRECSNYLSESSCRDDKCEIGVCKWTPLTNNVRDGVCINTEKDNCDLCNQVSWSQDDRHNKLFDFCNKGMITELNKQITDNKNKCYYIERDSTVKSYKKLTCYDLSNDDCSKSNQFGLSNCIINADTTKSIFPCIKDIDGDKISDCNLVMCDLFTKVCNDETINCIGDNIPPTIEILLPQSSELLKFTKVVLKTNELETDIYFCLNCDDVNAQNCKAISTDNGNSQISLFGIGNEVQGDGCKGGRLLIGENILRLYSIDKNKNFVKKLISFVVDKTEPKLGYSRNPDDILMQGEIAKTKVSINLLDISRSPNNGIPIKCNDVKLCKDAECKETIPFAEQSNVDCYKNLYELITKEYLDDGKYILNADCVDGNNKHLPGKFDIHVHNSLIKLIQPVDYRETKPQTDDWARVIKKSEGVVEFETGNGWKCTQNNQPINHFDIGSEKWKHSFNINELQQDAGGITHIVCTKDSNEIKRDLKIIVDDKPSEVWAFNEKDEPVGDFLYLGQIFRFMCIDIPIYHSGESIASSIGFGCREFQFVLCPDEENDDNCKKKLVNSPLITKLLTDSSLYTKLIQETTKYCWKAKEEFTNNPSDGCNLIKISQQQEVSIDVQGVVDIIEGNVLKKYLTFNEPTDSNNIKTYKVEFLSTKQLNKAILSIGTDISNGLRKFEPVNGKEITLLEQKTAKEDGKYVFWKGNLIVTKASIDGQVNFKLEDTSGVIFEGVISIGKPIRFQLDTFDKIDGEQVEGNRVILGFDKTPYYIRVDGPSINNLDIIGEPTGSVIFQDSAGKTISEDQPTKNKVLVVSNKNLKIKGDVPLDVTEIKITVNGQDGSELSNIIIQGLDEHTKDSLRAENIQSWKLENIPQSVIEIDKLLSTFEGEVSLSVSSIDILGNKGPIQHIIKILKDTTSPALVTNTQTPANGIILPPDINNKVKISAQFSDTGTGIDKSSIKFDVCKFEEEEPTLSPTPPCITFDSTSIQEIEDNDPNKITKVGISYNLIHTQTEKIANYKVFVSVNDEVGNPSEIKDWKFTVDPSIAVPPVFKIMDTSDPPAPPQIADSKKVEALHLNKKDTTIRIDFTDAINNLKSDTDIQGIQQRLLIKSITLKEIGKSEETNIDFNPATLPTGSGDTQSYIEIPITIPDLTKNYQLKVVASRAVGVQDAQPIWGKENPYTVNLILDTVKPVLEDITLIKLAGQSNKYTITGKYKEENLQSIGYNYKEGGGNFGDLILLENFGEGIFSIEDIIINSIDTFEFELQLKDKSDNLKTVNFKPASSDKFSITETNLGYKDTTTNQIYINNPDITLTGTAIDTKSIVKVKYLNGKELIGDGKIGSNTAYTIQLKLGDKDAVYDIMAYNFRNTADNPQEVLYSSLKFNLERISPSLQPPVILQRITPFTCQTTPNLDIELGFTEPLNSEGIIAVFYKQGTEPVSQQSISDFPVSDDFTNQNYLITKNKQTIKFKPCKVYQPTIENGDTWEFKLSNIRDLAGNKFGSSGEVIVKYKIDASVPVVNSIILEGKDNKDNQISVDISKETRTRIKTLQSIKIGVLGNEKVKFTGISMLGDDNKPLVTITGQPTFKDSVYTFTQISPQEQIKDKGVYTLFLNLQKDLGNNILGEKEAIPKQFTLDIIDPTISLIKIDTIEVSNVPHPITLGKHTIEFTSSEELNPAGTGIKCDDVSVSNLKRVSGAKIEWKGEIDFSNLKDKQQPSCVFTLTDLAGNVKIDERGGLVIIDTQKPKITEMGLREKDEKGLVLTENSGIVLVENIPKIYYLSVKTDEKVSAILDVNGLDVELPSTDKKLFAVTIEFTKSGDKVTVRFKNGAYLKDKTGTELKTDIQLQLDKENPIKLKVIVVDLALPNGNSETKEQPYKIDLRLSPELCDGSSSVGECGTNKLDSILIDEISKRGITIPYTISLDKKHTLQFKASEELSSAGITCFNKDDQSKKSTAENLQIVRGDKTTWKGELNFKSINVENNEEFNCEFKLTDLSTNVGTKTLNNLIKIDSIAPTITGFIVKKGGVTISPNGDGVLGKYADNDNYRQNSYEVSFKVEDTGQNTNTPTGAAVITGRVVEDSRVGSGDVYVSPSVVIAGTTDNEIVFTYIANQDMTGGMVILTIPIGWTVPQTTDSTKAGYVHNGANTGNPQISSPLIRDREIITDMRKMSNGESIKIIYGYGKSTAGVTPGSSAEFLFKSGVGDNVAKVSSSPTINVVPQGSGIGIVTVLPTSVISGTNNNKIVFTYKSTQTIDNLFVGLTIPDGWTIPQINSPNEHGYIEVSGFSSPTSISIPGINGRQIIVKINHIENDGSFQIVYGSDNSVAGVIPGSTAKFKFESGKEANALIEIANSPTITVNPAPTSSQEQLKILGLQATITKDTITQPITIQITDDRSTPLTQNEDVTVILATSTTTGKFDTSQTGTFDGSIKNIVISKGSSSSTIYYKDTTVGTATITASATGYSSASQTITITGSPTPNPPPTVSMSANPTSGAYPLTVTFIATATDSDGINSYSWDFGDRVASTQQNPTHTYQSARNYAAKLEVTDNKGAKTVNQITITLNQPSPPPSQIAYLYINDKPFVLSSADTFTANLKFSVKEDNKIYAVINQVEQPIADYTNQDITVNIKVTAIDNAGNIGEIKQTYTLDITPPQIKQQPTILSVGGKNYLIGTQNSMSANVIAEISGTDASNVKLFLSTDNILDTEPEITGIVPTHPLGKDTYTWYITDSAMRNLNLQDGRIVPFIKALDSVGNLITSEPISPQTWDSGTPPVGSSARYIIKDAIGPTITATPRGSITTDNLQNLNLLIDVSDPNGVNTDSKTYCFKLYQQSKDPNIIECQSISTPTTIDTGSGTPTVRFKPTFSKSSDTKPTTYSIYFSAEDKPGNKATITQSVSVDPFTITTLPDNAIAIYYTKDRSPVRLTCNPNPQPDSNFAQCESDNGNYKNHIYTNNNGINQISITLPSGVDIVEQTFIVDNVAVPLVTQAITNSHYAIRSGGITSGYTINYYPLAVFTQGKHDIKFELVRVFDTTTGTQSPFTYTLHVDTTPPIIKEFLITSPQIKDTQFINTDKVKLKVTAEEDSDDTKITNIRISQDRAFSTFTECKPITVSAKTYSCEFEYSLSGGEGVKLIFARVLNIGGSSADSQPITLNLDKNPPQITGATSSTHPPTQWTQRTDFSITWSVTDTNPISDYSFAVNEKARLSKDNKDDIDSATGKIKGEITLTPEQLDDAITNKAFSTALPVQDGQAKKLYFHLRVKDSAGNWGPDTTTGYELLIDKKSPSIISRKPANGEVIADNTPLINIKLDGIDSDVKTCSLTVGELPTVQCTVTNNEISYQVTQALSVPPSGTAKKAVVLFLEDKAGNKLKEGDRIGTVTSEFIIDPNVIIPKSVILEDELTQQKTENFVTKDDQSVIYNQPLITITYKKEIKNFEVQLNNELLAKQDGETQTYGKYWIKSANLISPENYEITLATLGSSIIEGRHTLKIITKEGVDTPVTKEYHFSIDSKPPEASELSISPAYISPNDDAIQDLAIIKFKPSEQVKYKIELTEGTKKRTIPTTEMTEFVDVIQEQRFDGKADTGELMINPDLLITLFDKAGNKAEIKREKAIFIDTQTPSITDFKLEPQKTVYKDEAISISFKTEKLKDNECLVNIDGQRFTCTEQRADTSYTYTSTIPAQQQGFEGTKEMLLTLTDLAGNTLTEKKQIEIDTSNPRIINQYPLRYSNGKNVVVSAEIYDKNLDTTSGLKLIFDGNEVVHSFADNKITYLGGDLEQRDYNIEIIAKDSVGHQTNLKWTFTVNQNFPPEPVVSVIPSSQYEGRVYTNQKTPQINILFDTIDEIEVKNVNVGGVDITNKCTSTETNIWACNPEEAQLSKLNDGNIEIRVKANKKSMDEELEFPTSYILDTITPSLEILTQLPQTTDKKSITIDYKYVDKNMNKIGFSGDVKESISVELPPTETLTQKSQLIEFSDGDGSKTISTTAIDRAGNRKVVELKTVLDTEPPEIALTSITNDKGAELIKEGDIYKTKESKVIINGIITSEETALPIIYEEATPSNKAVVTQDKKFSITITLQSGREVLLTVQDANNKNLISRVAVNVVLDTHAPEIKITEPLNLVSSLRQPTIKVKIDDNEDAKCTISYNLPPQIDSSLEPNDFAREFTYKFQYITTGELAFSIKCADRLGNENKADYKIKIDEVKPIISKIKAINGNEISPGQFLIIQPAVTSLEITTNEPARCKYGSGTVYEEMTKFPEFDDITNAYKTTLNSATINLESVKDIQQTYNLICEDKAGLLSDMSTIKVTFNPDSGVIISELTPAITNNKRATIRAKTDVKAKCSIDRAYSGLEGFLFDILDPPKEMYSANGIEHNYPNNANEWKEDFKDAGVYNFDITCIDTQNSARKPGSAVHTLKTDFTIPVKPLITSPINNVKVSQKDITIIGSVAEAELIVKINFNGKETVITSDKLVQDEDKYTFTLPTQLADGENRIYAVAYDQANNPSDESITDSEITKVYYIISAPTIRAIIPSATVREADKIEISYNLIQDVAIKDVTLRLTRTYKDGSEDKTEDITTTKQFTDELKNNVVFDPDAYDKLPDGKYKAEISVEDTLGNKNTETKEFTVDPRVPSIIITEPVLAPVIKTRENTFKIKGNVIDETYQLTSVILSHNNQDLSIPLSQDKHSANIDTTLNLVDGENTIIIKATNQISQKNTATLEFVVVVDKTVEGGEILIE